MALTSFLYDPSPRIEQSQSERVSPRWVSSRRFGSHQHQTSRAGARPRGGAQIPTGEKQRAIPRIEKPAHGYPLFWTSIENEKTRVGNLREAELLMNVTHRDGALAQGRGRG